MIFVSFSCFADGVSFIPLLNYEYVSLTDQRLHEPGGGLVFLHGNQNPPLSEKPKALLIGLLYKAYVLEEIPPDYASLYHDIDFVIEKRIGPHLLQGMFTAYSDQPIYGGFHTTASILGYGYELIRKERIRLTLGLSVMAGDFGLTLPDGTMWPLLPRPILRFAFDSRYLTLAYDYPKLSLTLLPENNIRLTGTVTYDPYTLQDIHDLRFSAILWYRFFDKNSPLGDFLGAGAGVQNAGQNSGVDFVLAEKNKKYDLNHYSVFAVIDAGFLKLSGGYIFYSREVYGGNYSLQSGNGFFVKAELLYQFK
jgi:hypothetical protein